MRERRRPLALIISAAVICLLTSACDPGYNTDSYISNLSSYSVTISSYKYYDGESDEANMEPVTIQSGSTVLFYQDGGLGTSSQYGGSDSFLRNCPNGCEILFEDGKVLRFRPVEATYRVDSTKFETHSPYSPYSHEFEMLEKGFCSTYGKTVYVITDDDHGRAD